MSAPGFEPLVAALAGHDPRRVETSGPRAAVALVLRDGAGGRPELLFIRRARDERDPWSGHMGFPGGRAEPFDASAEATAIRETREETGIDLTGAPVLGRLGAIRAIAKGRILPMTITPFIFHLVEDQPITLSPEAVDAFWFPLDSAARGEIDDRYEYRLGPVPWHLPCWRWEGRTVWGLTHQMLNGLLEVVR